MTNEFNPILFKLTISFIWFKLPVYVCLMAIEYFKGDDEKPVSVAGVTERGWPVRIFTKAR